MKLIKIAIISILVLASFGQSQDGEMPVDLENQEDQLDQQQRAQEKAYYQGDFDNYDRYEQQQAEPETQQIYEEEERDMLEFSEHMGDFIPDETFIFKLKQNSEESFLLWPFKDVQSIRGMFHSEIDSDELEDYVNLDLYEDDKIIRQFKQQRLGIFNIIHNTKDSKYKFKFTSTVAEVSVYVSYEYVTKAKLEEKTSNISSIEQAANKFTKVNMLALAQQTEMSRIISISRKHQERIDKYLSQLQFSLLLETAVIIAGSCYTLSLLRKQIYAGYELLV